MKKIITWENKTAKKEHLKVLISDVNKEAISYKKHYNYDVGDYIHHFRFGFGFIQKIISHTRIEVLFEGSEKVMLQNWQQS